MGVMENTWRGLPYPTQPGQVGGHEGVGIVQKLGLGVGDGTVKLGDRVGIKVCLGSPSWWYTADTCTVGRLSLWFLRAVPGGR